MYWPTFCAVARRFALFSLPFFVTAVAWSAERPAMHGPLIRADVSCGGTVAGQGHMGMPIEQVTTTPFQYTPHATLTADMFRSRMAELLEPLLSEGGPEKRRNVHRLVYGADYVKFVTMLNGIVAGEYVFGLASGVDDDGSFFESHDRVAILAKRPITTAVDPRELIRNPPPIVGYVEMSANWFVSPRWEDPDSRRQVTDYIRSALRADAAVGAQLPSRVLPPADNASLAASGLGTPIPPWPSYPIYPSTMQRAVFGNMTPQMALSWEDEVRSGDFGLVKMGVQSSGATGKTVMSALQARAMADRTPAGKPNLTIFFVHDSSIHHSAVPTYMAALGLTSPQQVLRMYPTPRRPFLVDAPSGAQVVYLPAGNTNPSVSQMQNARLLMATRQVGHRQRARIREAAQAVIDAGGTVTIVLDEAHRAGAAQDELNPASGNGEDDVPDSTVIQALNDVTPEADGSEAAVQQLQYWELVQELNQISLRAATQDGKKPPTGQILYVSATMWRKGTDIVLNPQHLGYKSGPFAPPEGERYALRGKIVGGMLTPAENEALRRGDREPISAAKVQLKRSVTGGYVAPVFAIEMPVARQTNQRRRLARLNELRGSDSLVLARRSELYTQIVDDLVEQIRAAREYVIGQVDGTDTTIYWPTDIPDRGIIFCSGRDKIDALASHLNAAFAKLNINTVFRSHHGNSPSSQQVGGSDSTLSWLKDEGAFNTINDRIQGKFAIVDGKFLEGVDIPGLNIGIFLKAQYANDASHVRSAIQQIVRLLREHHHKVGARLVDYSGITRAILDDRSLPVIRVAPPRGGRDEVNPPIHVNVINSRVFDIATQSIQMMTTEMRARFRNLSEARRLAIAAAPFLDQAPANLTADPTAVMARGESVSALAFFLDMMLESLRTSALVEVHEGHHSINVNALQTIDPVLRNFLQRHGNALLSAYAGVLTAAEEYVAMRGMLAEAEANEPSLVPEARQGTQEALAALRKRWFLVKALGRELDPHRSRQAILKLTNGEPRAADRIMGLNAMQGFYDRLLSDTVVSAINTQEAREDNDRRLNLGQPNLEFSPVTADGLEVEVTGMYAYSMLVAERGMQTLVAQLRAGGSRREDGVERRHQIRTELTVATTSDEFAAVSGANSAETSVHVRDINGWRQRLRNQRPLFEVDGGVSITGFQFDQRPSATGAPVFAAGEEFDREMAKHLRRSQDLYLGPLIIWYTHVIQAGGRATTPP